MLLILHAFMLECLQITKLLNDFWLKLLSLWNHNFKKKNPFLDYCLRSFVLYQIFRGHQIVPILSQALL